MDLPDDYILYIYSLSDVAYHHFKWLFPCIHFNDPHGYDDLRHNANSFVCVCSCLSPKIKERNMKG